MAIYPKLGDDAQSNPSIEAWTEQVTQSFTPIQLALPGTLQDTTASPRISIDEYYGHKNAGKTETATYCDNSSTQHQTHREPLQRDSLNRREALLRGKEGSRRRQRWENGSYQREA